MKYIIRAVFIIMGAITLVGCTGTKTGFDEEIERSKDEVEQTLGALEQEKEVVEDLKNQLADKEDIAQELEQSITEFKDKIKSIEAELLEKSGSADSFACLSQTVIELIRDEDYSTLATYVDPIKGLRLSPYSYVDISGDIVLSVADVAMIDTSVTSYLWGSYDGSGDPINDVPSDYFDEFVYDEDYANPHMFGNNTFIGTGNMINNIMDEYPSSGFIEYHFTGFNPAYEGMDWSSVVLVYEQTGSTWYLVGIVHRQWTT